MDAIMQAGESSAQLDRSRSSSVSSRGSSEVADTDAHMAHGVDTVQAEEAHSRLGNGHAVDNVVVDVGGDDFDWEQYIAPYSGRTRIDRLLFLAKHSPALRSVCSEAALRQIVATSKDTQLYRDALAVRNTSAKEGNTPLPSEQQTRPDAQWLDTMERNNRTELEKLDLELRNYQNNMIKESTRMGHRDLANHLRAIGDLRQAQRLYIKTRDYCTTSEHVVEMCLNVIGVSLDLGDYGLVLNYVSKAEGLLASYNPVAAAESANKSAKSGQPAQKGASTSGADAIGALFRAGGSAGAQESMSFSSASAMLNAQRGSARRDVDESNKREVAAIRSRLGVAEGLALLGMGKYEAAALSFLAVDASQGQAYSMMASQSDVAIYLVLCSVALFDRHHLKTQVMDKPDINAMLEADARAKQMLDSFYSCEYKRALALLEQSRVRLLLDLHFSAHFEQLSTRITQRILRQYIVPFSTLKIDRLAASLGWTGHEGEARAIDEVLGLIQQKLVHARLDLPRKTIIANKMDQRQALFDHALQSGAQQTASAKHLMLRVDLLQNGLVVKLPQEAA